MGTMERQNDRYPSDNTPHRGERSSPNGTKGKWTSLASSDTCSARPWIAGAGWRLLSLVAIVAGLMAPSFVHAATPNTWTSLSSLPIARAYLGGAAGPDGRIYAIGGRCGYCYTNPRQAVDAYDPSTNTWTTRADLPTRRDSLAAATGADGRIYAIGGCDDNGNPLSRVDAYTPSTNSWTAVAPMPTARCELAAVAAPDGRIYALGGFNSNGQHLATVEAYTPSTNSWQTVASMPTAREGLGAAVGQDGRIYAIGGYNGIGGALSTVEAYTPSTNSWATVASLHTRRLFLSAATGPDGRIYAMGGLIYGGAGTFLSSVEAYTPSTNSWTNAASLPAAQYGAGAATGPDGRIYNFGGNNASGSEIDSVEAYLTVATIWVHAAPLNTPRFTLATSNGPCQGNTSATCLYAIGGYNGGDLSSVEMFTPSSNSWSNVTSLNTARSGLRATSGPCQGNTSATCLYAVGGYNNGYLSSVEMYTPSSNSWSIVASLNTARYNFGATSGPCQGNASATCLYAVGGYSSAGNLSSVEMYSPGSNSWNYVASLTTAPYSFAATSGPCQGNTSATCLYAVGGYNAGYLSSVEMYTPSNNSWSTVASLHTARNSLGATSGPCQGNISTTCLYAIGGFDSGTVLSSVEMYTPSSNSWSAVPSLNTARNNLGATSGPCETDTSTTCLYAIGGQDSARNALSSVEMYAPANSSSNPTAAWVSPFVVRRHGETVHFQWQAPGAASTGSRLLGFNLFAGGHRLNPHLIRVHGQGIHSHVYHFTARRAGHGPYTLMAVLANGTQLAVAHG